MPSEVQSIDPAERATSDKGTAAITLDRGVAKDPWGRVMVTQPLRFPRWVKRPIKEAILKGLPKGVYRYPGTSPWGDIIVWIDRGGGWTIVETYQEFPSEEQFYLDVARGDRDIARLLRTTFTQLNREIWSFIKKGYSPSQAIAEVRRINDEVFRLTVEAAAIMVTGGSMMAVLESIRKAAIRMSSLGLRDKSAARVSAQRGLEAKPTGTKGGGGHGGDGHGAPSSRGEGGKHRPTLRQRQRAGSLTRAAAQLEKDAARLESRAAKIAKTKPERAGRMRNRAADLRKQANKLTSEAEEFQSGRRSATADLPGPEDVEKMFEQPEFVGLIQIPLSRAERQPGLLIRAVRSIFRSKSGNRVVFRVEGGGSRELITITESGQVSVARGSTIHLNFGSPERAAEFLMKRGPGAKIVAFEVEEAWVKAVRSASIPEHGTKPLRGQPRLVDVTYAHDQMEIPASLVDELAEFIVQGTGRILALF